MKYIATIRHHSIASARHITINVTLTKAKRAASREFGDEQRDYDIVISLDRGDGQTDIIASRKAGAPSW